MASRSSEVLWEHCKWQTGTHKMKLIITVCVPDRIGVLGAGGVTNANPEGWRDIFWMQAAFHLAASLGLLFFYHPTRTQHARGNRLSLRELVWACDPIGSGLFITSATLLLLALDWAGGTFTWSDAHVAAPLTIGCVLLLAFALYGTELQICAKGILLIVDCRSFFRVEGSSRRSCGPRVLQR